MAEAEEREAAETKALPVEEKEASRPRKEGSTRLPQFPMVHIVKPNVGKRTKITFDEVPELRKEMKTRLFKIDKREKFNKDHKRAVQDFYRMELDRLSKIGDDNRRHMCAAIKVYLGQTKGSSKAIESLIKQIEPKMKDT